MKFKVLLFIGALALGGCQTAQDLATTITTSTQTATQKVKSVQGYAVAACGYLPLATTVASIFTKYSTDVATVGGAICDAVTTLPLADGPGDGKPRVAGVVVQGKFVK